MGGGPAGGRDPWGGGEFLEVSIELLKQDGSTMLFSSRYMTEVERIAGRVAVIEEGEKLLDIELDAFHQEYCLAILPQLSEDTAERLRALNGFVRSRKRDNSLVVVFSRQPEDLKAELANGLGISDARCTQASLEEMFVALVGAES